MITSPTLLSISKAKYVLEKVETYILEHIGEPNLTEKVLNYISQEITKQEDLFEKEYKRLLEQWKNDIE